MRPLLVLLVLLLGPGLAAAAPNPEQLASARELLAAELPLARGTKVYFLIDLDRSVVTFKASGVSLAELPILVQRTWGPASANSATRLLDKDALFEPQREVIRIPQPGQTPEIRKPADLPALELSDMPVRFRLYLADGTILRIGPRSGGGFGRGLDGLRSLGWLLTRPLISDWNFVRRRPYTEVRLALEADDARLLFWSLSEGADCLIIWPRGGSVGSPAPE